MSYLCYVENVWKMDSNGNIWKWEDFLDFYLPALPDHGLISHVFHHMIEVPDSIIEDKEALRRFHYIHC